jgi:hypothetical protein
MAAIREIPTSAAERRIMLVIRDLAIPVWVSSLISHI